MKTRNGKVARLPKPVREELNRRLENGEPGSRLVVWLNRRPDVQAVLATEFGGQPINDQNLAAWRQGGYRDWVRHQETRDFARSLVEEGQELAGESADAPLSDSLSAQVAVALGRLLREVAEAGEDAGERRRALLAVARELALLRRCDHEAARLRLERERWAVELGHEDAKQRAAGKMVPFQLMLLATAFGDLYGRNAKGTGQVPPEILAFLSALPPEQLTSAGATPEILQMLGIKANQGESSPIKPEPPPCL